MPRSRAAAQKASGPSEGAAASAGGSFYVGQVAKLLDISPSALRSWEEHGLLLPHRTASGYRVYSMADVDRARRIMSLTNDGANLASIRMLLEAQNSEFRNGAERGARNGTHPRPSQTDIGEKLRRLRKGKELSLRQLASVVDMSPSYLSMIERGGAMPTVASLQRLAAALGSSVQSILASDDDPPELGDSPRVRAKERRILKSVPSGTRLEDLSVAGSPLECLVFVLKPGAGSDGPVEHVGDEFVYVLRGQVRITLDSIDVYELGPHDSMSFASSRPHQWVNHGDKITELLWINTPRTF